MTRRILLFIAFSVSCVIFISSCKKEQFIEDSGARLSFSDDTIKFDTIFTTVGSATQVFLVYNNNDQPIKTSISLGSNQNFFRLNVDGQPGRAFNNVEIGANDSIWIFVEVTLDPNNINTPYLIDDSIVFVTNGNVQKIQLQSFGQNANFHPSLKYKEVIAPIFRLEDEKNPLGTTNIVFGKDIPHVIYGYAILDSGYTLTLEAGCRLHFHTRSGLIVLSGAKIISKGTKDDPVLIEGDRLGVDYQDVPGQWDRIQLSNLTHGNLVNGTSEIGAGPKDNVFDYTIIKNGYVGLEADTLDGNSVAVTLNNCILKNFASTALYGAGSRIRANNSVFANCKQYCTAFLYGGDYRLLHCTMANYWSSSERQTPSVFLNDYYDVPRNLDAYFGNCIIYGRAETELGLDSANVSGKFNFLFDHCLIKANSKTPTSDASHFKNVIRADGNNDPLFKDHDNNNYIIDASSPAADKGDINITNLDLLNLSKDLKGDPRPQGNAPDLGAYEVK